MNDLSTMAPVCECGREKKLHGVGKGRKKQWKCAFCRYHSNPECRKKSTAKWRLEHLEHRSQYKKQYGNTPAGYTTQLWNDLNRRCVNGSCTSSSKSCENYLKKGIELRITRDELLRLVQQNWDTIQTLRLEGKTPSIDRIGPTNIHYEIGNIQFISLTDNCVKANKARTK